MLVAIGVDDGAKLAVLSSRLHVALAIAAGGWLGVGNDPRYSKTRTFDPFPFPTAVTDPAVDTRALADLGERLDAFRTDRLAALTDLTMTKLYNALERYREARNGGEPLSEEEREIHTRAQVAILAEIHDEIDRAVLAAYGWDDLAPALVGRPGGTVPSDLKAEDQLAAEEDLLARLVALNQARAAEEKRGHVRWLRPDYQIPRLGHRVSTAGEQAEADVEVVPVAAKPAWPSSSLPEQIVLVRDLLKKANAPVPAAAIAAAFDGRNTRQRKDRIAELLDSLVATGAARSGETPDGERRYFAV